MARNLWPNAGEPVPTKMRRASRCRSDSRGRGGGLPPDLAMLTGTHSTRPHACAMAGFSDQGED